MESLGDILRRLTARDIRRTTNGDNVDDYAGAEPEEPAAPSCPVCGDAGWVSKRVPVGHPDFGEAFPCRCQQQQDPISRAEALRRYSNLGALGSISLAETNPAGNSDHPAEQRMFEGALSAAAAFALSPSGWLVFTGPSGSGKTHLAAAVANRCIELGCTTYFIVAADLLDHLRAAYAPDNAISYDVLFEQVRNVPVLVLDDLTAQATTAWAQEKLFQIISHRFTEGLPTIITVRGSVDRLDEGLRTRMESRNGLSRVFSLGQHNLRQTRNIGAIPLNMQRRMTLESFNAQGSMKTTQLQQETLARSKLAAEQYVESPEGWLMFTGPRGCGKTHLAVGIAGELQRRGRRVFYAFVPSLLDHLRATFSPDSPIGYDELFEQVKTTDLLVLDDLGTESSTAWAEEKLYQIVVYRYDALLPTIITSVFSVEELEDMKPRIGSRLVDGMTVNWQAVSAPNYRDQRRQN